MFVENLIENAGNFRAGTVRWKIKRTVVRRASNFELKFHSIFRHLNKSPWILC